MANDKLTITGVLLTGGESRRMGTNKALLEFGGRTLIEKNLDVLSQICSEVLISSRDEELYNGYGYEVVTDAIKGKGPLGGIYTVLQKAQYELLFLAACDMPFLNKDAIRILYKEIGDFDAVVPHVAGRLHPLHALYHKRLALLVEEKIQGDKLRLTDVLSECRTKVFKLDSSQEISQKRLIERSVLNANTPEEWENLVKGMKLN